MSFTTLRALKLFQRTEVPLDWPCRTQQGGCFAFQTQKRTVLRLWSSSCACCMSFSVPFSFRVPLGLEFCFCGCLQTLTLMEELWKTSVVIFFFTFNQLSLSSPVDSCAMLIFLFLCFCTDCKMASNDTCRELYLASFQNLDSTIKGQRNLFGEICCAKTFPFDAFDTISGYLVGNSLLTCLAKPAASLKSAEMVCVIESVESNRFPLTSNLSNFFEFFVWQTVCTKSKLCWFLSSSTSYV